MRIEIIEEGNRTTEPSISAETVNEAFGSVEVFSVDAGTEFLWALAAVVGCFSMVLIPSFTVYFAARAKEKVTRQNSNWPKHRLTRRTMQTKPKKFQSLPLNR